MVRAEEHNMAWYYIVLIALGSLILLGIIMLIVVYWILEKIFEDC
jgi:hypothetical protein